MARPAGEGPAAGLWHPAFVGAGTGLLIAAFVTDVLYYRNSLWEWSNFSAWLIVLGLIAALLAAIVLMIELAVRRAGRIDWVQFGLLAVAAVLSIVNAFVHSRDAWTSVVPEGIWISGIVALLLLFAGRRGWRVTAPRLEGDRA